MASNCIARVTCTYSVCPSCGGYDGQVDHLINTESSTQWYCRHCGNAYDIVFHTSGLVETSIAKNRRVRTIDILELPPQSSSVFFAVEGSNCKLENEPFDIEEHNKSYYEEHSCPTNWLNPEVIYFRGSLDPHGLIKYVTSKEGNSDNLEDAEEFISEIAEMREKEN